jgi:hypothetical protein
MLIARAVPIVGVATMLAVSVPALSAPAAAAGPALDVAPVLTSTPFASPPGQRVTHTISLSGTGSGPLTAVRVTFTTTVDLDGVTATPSVGSCPIVTSLTIVCDLGNVDFSDANSAGTNAAAAPKVTITGTVHSGAAPGTLVQNLVNVTSGTPDADPANNVASNAYLVAGAISTPTRSSAPARPSSGPAAASGISAVPVIAMLVIAMLALAALAMTALIVVRRRRSLSRRSSSGGDHDDV